MIVSILITLALLPPVGLPPTITESSLPEELRSLAEGILESAPENEYIPVTDNLLLRLDFENYGFSHEARHSLCIEFSATTETSYYRQSYIFLNGTRVYGVYAGFSNNNDRRCFQSNLEAGLHLIEFHLRDSMWGEPVAIQRWAIEIE